MKYSKIDVYDFYTETHMGHSTKELVLKDFTKYPNNSIVHKDIYTKLLNNIDKIPILELDEFLNKYNCL